MESVVRNEYKALYVESPFTKTREQISDSWKD